MGRRCTKGSRIGWGAWNPRIAISRGEAKGWSRCGRGYPRKLINSRVFWLTGLKGLKGDKRGLKPAQNDVAGSQDTLRASKGLEIAAMQDWKAGLM